MHDLSRVAEVEIVLVDTTEVVRTIVGALKPEVERPSSNRSTIDISGEANTLRMSIMASDISALRAALNSYLRWVEVIIDAVKTLR